jgi:hypothetical protein
MRFRYLGDHKAMIAFDYDFADGATPDVTDEEAIAKLQGNAEFEAIEEDKTFGTPVRDKKQKATAAPMNPEDDKKETSDFVQDTLLE